MQKWVQGRESKALKANNNYQLNEVAEGLGRQSKYLKSYRIKSRKEIREVNRKSKMNPNNHESKRKNKMYKRNNNPNKRR